MQLLNGSEPLILADGTKIDPSGKVIKDDATKFISVPSGVEAQAIVARTRRTVAELPVPPQQLSGVALVAFYTLFGLNDTDICIAVNNKLTLEQIENIRSQEAYIDFMVTAKKNILNTETDHVRELFAKNAANAAQKIIDFATGENDVLAFTASKDVLDRAGHRPADIVEHHHKMDDALNIVITRKDENNQLPVIDITAEEVA